MACSSPRTRSSEAFHSNSGFLLRLSCVVRRETKRNIKSLIWNANPQSVCTSLWIFKGEIQGEPQCRGEREGEWKRERRVCWEFYAGSIPAWGISDFFPRFCQIFTSHSQSSPFPSTFHSVNLLANAWLKQTSLSMEPRAQPRLMRRLIQVHTL